MDPLVTLVLFASFVILLAVGAPIYLSLGLSALIVIAVFDLVPLAAVPSQIQGSLSSFTLLAVPFFIFAGNLLAGSELTARLIDLSRAVVGRVRGGLAIVTTITGVFFAGISGSGPADTAALGATLLPALDRDRYDKGFSAALVAASGAIGIIVPPSIALIIYGVVANASIGRLFLAGVLPGVLVAVSLAVVSVIQSRRKGYGPLEPAHETLASADPIGSKALAPPHAGSAHPEAGQERRTEAGKVTGTEDRVAVHVETGPVDERTLAAPPRPGRARLIAHTFRRAVWGLLAPLIILGGIYGGIFTPTEAAAVVVLYALFVGVFVYRDMRIKSFISVLAESTRTTGVVMIIVACASLFAFLLNTQGIARAAATGLADAIPNAVLTLLLINVILLVAGAFLDAISVFYILTPILLPTAVAFGVDPIHFGIIMCVNLAIGQITPPVGVNLYVAAAVGRIPVARVIGSLGPILLAELVALGIITFVPGLSLWLPDVLGVL
ncbi:MAG: TRAP transporter large permease [Geodermatophilaceae bacterium]